jgi:hypothetical protein
LLVALWVVRRAAGCGATARRAATALVAVLALPATARAQGHDGFAVERFRLAGDGEGLIGVDWAGVPYPGSWDAALWLGASHDPLVVYPPGEADEPAAALVARRVGSGVSLSVVPWRRLQLTGAIGAVAFQDDRDVAAVHVGDPPALPTGGLGDARLAGKLGLLGGPDARLHLALTPSVTVPLGGARGFLREAGPTLEPEAALGVVFGATRVALNAGYRLRRDQMAVSLRIGDELYARAGAAVRLGPAEAPRGELLIAVAAATAAAAPLGGQHRDALELLIGGAVPRGSLQLFAAAGVGIGSGWGTPDWRVVIGTRVRVAHRDRDGDGIVDRHDRCPLEPEDHDGFQDDDGCPDPDNDGDGIPDAVDRCPLEPEDHDGFQDDDGCPDPDNDGDGIPDAVDRCPLEPETPNGWQDDDGCPDELPVVLQGRVLAGGAPLPGVAVTITGAGEPQALTSDADGGFALTLAGPATVTIEARAPRHRPGVVTLEARAQLAPTEIALDLEPLPPTGEIRGLVRDFRGRALAAQVRVEPGGAVGETDADGLFRLEVPPGSYQVTIEAAGHRGQTRRVRVEPDGVTVLNADLRQGK